MKVMEFILPATEYWLVDAVNSGQSGDAPQGVLQERYWLRVINEAIAKDDILDQEVLRDIRNWAESPSVNADLIAKLTAPSTRNELLEESTYNNVWERLAGSVLGVGDNPDRILLLCEHVIAKILQLHGSAASQWCEGFAHTWRLAGHRVSLRPENRAWLERRIAEALS